MLEKQSDLPTINKKGDDILMVNSNAENVTRVNNHYADLKQRTEDTLAKLDNIVGQLEKDLESTKKFVSGSDELESVLEEIRNKITAMEPVGKDTEKIKEQLEQYEVSRLFGGEEGRGYFENRVLLRYRKCHILRHS